ncbi:MAG: DnaJ domain-containing protein [Alphaproteobacteria bacterium]|nr:DnaJ domain-containing protein [Alphaproteobacteria bacterium]
MQFLLLGLALLALVVLLVHGLAGPGGARLASQIRVAAGALIIALAGILAMRGGAAFALPLAALGVWLISANSLTGGPRSVGQVSEVTTEYLEMQLDHDTGEIRGLVIKGIFTGRRIEKLKPAELALLWQDVRVDDPASAQLIEAFLDRTYPTWRDDMARGEEEMAGPDGRMSKVEAYGILGLKPGASADDIRRAHKELMLKLHPDRGGSTYLASKINEAKEVLLNSV